LAFARLWKNKESGGFWCRHIYESTAQEIGITCPAKYLAILESIITGGANPVIVDSLKDENCALLLNPRQGLSF